MFINMIFKIIILTIKEIINRINLTTLTSSILSNNNFVIIISIYIYIFFNSINSTRFLTINKYLFIKLRSLLNVSNESL